MMCCYETGIDSGCYRCKEVTTVFSTAVAEWEVKGGCSWAPNIITFGISIIEIPGTLPNAAVTLGVCANPTFRVIAIH
jgi:hypothetical protein